MCAILDCTSQPFSYFDYLEKLIFKARKYVSEAPKGRNIGHFGIFCHSQSLRYSDSREKPHGYQTKSFGGKAGYKNVFRKTGKKQL